MTALLSSLKGVLMNDDNKVGEPTVTLDVRVPLSVKFEQVGSRINFVLEEANPAISTDKASAAGDSGYAKYALYKVEE